MAAAVAAAEAVQPGSGPLVCRVIMLVRGAGQLVTLEDMEALAVEESRRAGRDALQLALDNQAFAECWLPAVTGADGIGRARRADSSRQVLTLLGHVRVRRAAYRSGDRGVAALHPRDAALNLPPGGFSWQLRKLAEMTCRSGTYASAAEIVRAVTGENVWGRQLQEMMEDCAADAEEFARGRPVPRPPVLTGPDGTRAPAAGVASADGKGVSMLTRDLREDAARRAAKKDGPAARRLGAGEKSAAKRMAETCVVYDCLPPAGDPRTPEEIMRRPRGEPGRYPRAVNRTYACDITASCADVIEEGVFAEIDRRDPRHERQWIGLVDGNNDQIRAFTGKAAERGMDMPLLIDSSTSWTTCGRQPGASSPPAASRPPRPWSPAGARTSCTAGPRTSSPTSPAAPPLIPPDPAASTPRASPGPPPTWQTRNPTWTTPQPSPAGGRSRRGSSREHAATSWPTACRSAAPGGACPAPSPSCGCAPSTPAATPTPTGTTTSKPSTSATTSADTTTPPRSSRESPEQPGSRRTSKSTPNIGIGIRVMRQLQITRKEPHPCHIGCLPRNSRSGGLA